MAGKVKTVRAGREGTEKTLLPPNRNKLKGFTLFTAKSWEEEQRNVHYRNRFSEKRICMSRKYWFSFFFKVMIPCSDTAAQHTLGVSPERERKKVIEKTGRKVFSTSEIRATYCKATQLELLKLSILSSSQKSVHAWEKWTVSSRLWHSKCWLRESPGEEAHPISSATNSVQLYPVTSNLHPFVYLLHELLTDVSFVKIN